VREAKPHKHCFGLSIINSKEQPSLTYSEEVEERLVTESDNTLMKCVTFLDAQYVLAEPVSPALICPGLLLPCGRVRLAEVRETPDRQPVSGITSCAVPKALDFGVWERADRTPLHCFISDRFVLVI